MEIVYTKSCWEMDMSFLSNPLATFIERVASDGFDGTELFLPLVNDSPETVVGLHEEHGLKYRVIDIITEGATPLDHKESFDAAVDRAITYKPMLINSHTGREHLFLRRQCCAVPPRDRPQR